jgi:Ni,Fe-hydrogenase III large subunit
MEILWFKSKDNVEVEDRGEWRRIIEQEVERMGKLCKRSKQ